MSRLFDALSRGGRDVPEAGGAPSLDAVLATLAGRPRQARTVRWILPLLVLLPILLAAAFCSTRPPAAM